MRDLDEIRKSFPQLSHIPDYDLAEMLHEKHFSEVPKEEYYRNIGLDVPGAKRFQPENYQGSGEATARAIGRAPENVVHGAKDLVMGLLGLPFNPIQAPKAFGAEALKGGNTLAQNLPNNVVEYLRENQHRKNTARREKIDSGNHSPMVKKLLESYYADELSELPNWVSGDWASPETKDTMNRFTEEYAPKYEDNASTRLAGTIGKYTPATLAAGGNAFAGIAAQDIAENENPINGVLTAKLLKEGTKNIAPITKAAAKLTGKAVDMIPGGETVTKGIKVGGKAVSQPFKDISQAKKLQKALIEMDKQKLGLKKGLDTTQESIEKGKESRAARIAKNIADDTKAVEAESSGLKKFAPIQEAEARGTSQKSLYEKSRELRTEANENFNNVYAEPVGSKTLGTMQLEHPLVKSNIEAGYYKDAINYLENSAKAGHEIPASLRGASKSNPTVKQAVDFAKLVQKEKLRAYEKGKNTNLPEAESRNYESMYKKLSELEKDAWSELEQNLNPKQFGNIKEAFKKWGEIVTPFETHPFLENATAKFGKIDSKNIFESINKLGSDELVKRLTQDAKVNEAIAKHDLMGFDFENIKSVEKLLDSDQGRSLPIDVKNALKRQVKNLEKLNDNETAAKAISESQVKSILREPKIKAILQADPKLVRDIADAKTMKKGLKQLEYKMKEAGIEQKEIAARMGVINKIASHVGLGFILKVIH